jgi:FMN phosphatase YigB (HAD superfamily)
MLSKLKKLVRTLQFYLELIFKPRTRRAYNMAVKSGLFDLEWYEAHCGKFPHALDAFEDYLEKSCFSNVNPSANFDTEFYMRANTDIYHHGISPLIHYMYHGKYEGRNSSPVINRWTSNDELVPIDTSDWKSQKIAICLHVFYPDFVEKFSKCLKDFPCSVDVFVAASSDKIKHQAELSFNKISNVNAVKAVTAPNRGRNFGPLLVEFGSDLLEYDLMCHLHSKKSLYSGREQTQWFDYLNQYLLKDRHGVKSILRLFSEHDDLGIYYPTSFWMMPSWVNHWTCNKGFAAGFVEEWGIDISKNFINYPVGGMFWARPKALEPLLSKSYSYEDFPEEPLPNDGSWLHALERSIGLLTEKSGYKQFFYHPPIGKFTTDKSNIFSNYYRPPEQLFNDVRSFDIISFDIFDTVLRREFMEPEYAKFKLGKLLTQKGIVDSPDHFIGVRNEAEFSIRKSQQFQGDVCITDTYTKLAESLSIPLEEALLYMNLEFEFDLESVLPKDEMVSIVHRLHDLGREIWFITDIYYTKQQIETMLRKIGVSIPYKLFVSSDLGLRKDAGTMWSFIKEELKDTGNSHIHIGDNVRSDAQICGDFGLNNVHVLHPTDKWQASAFSSVMPHYSDKFDEAQVLKWGKLIGNNGRYPFIGE